MQQPRKKLLFENGQAFYGAGFGADAERVCEVVFNTSMVGYQEIFSDCAYHGQMVCMTYPLVGNYGMASEDYETRSPAMGGFIVREYNDSLANFRATKTLGEVMEENGIPGIEGVDTRRMARMLRSQGSMRAILCAADCPDEAAARRLRESPQPQGQVAGVSCKKRWFARASGARCSVAVLDCGLKLGLVNSLTARGCNVSVLPYNTPPGEVLALAPDGLLLSSGPGNPQDVPEGIGLVKSLWGKLPMFGVCLGHQLLALAAGGKTYKLKCGHHGGYPVKTCKGGAVEMTAQNHNYAVDAASLDNTCLAVTQLNLLDGSVEGMEDRQSAVLGVQYQPESSPGPQDAAHLFDRFTAMMDSHRRTAANRPYQVSARLQ